LKELEDQGKDKDRLLASMEESLKEKEEKLKQISQKYEALQVEEDKRSAYIQAYEKEKELLKQKINSLENNSKQQQFENEIGQYKSELNSKNQIIGQMQGRMSEIKASNEDLLNKVNTFYEDNSNLKEEIEKKNYLVEELISKIEGLRLEFDSKVEEKKHVTLLIIQ
jgi:chromosome segregation ATPase